MKARVNVFQGKNGMWYYNVQDGNGEIITQSEPYESRSNALRGVRNLQATIGPLDIRDTDGEDEVDAPLPEA